MIHFQILFVEILQKADLEGSFDDEVIQINGKRLRKLLEARKGLKKLLLGRASGMFNRYRRKWAKNCSVFSTRRSDASEIREVNSVVALCTLWPIFACIR